MSAKIIVHILNKVSKILMVSTNNVFAHFEKPNKRHRYHKFQPSFSSFNYFVAEENFQVEMF